METTAVSPQWGQTLAQAMPHLRSCARRHLSDPDEIADLAQAALLKALENEQKFREGSDLKAWLFTIVRNTFITAYQRQKRNPEQPLNDDWQEGGIYGSVSADVESGLGIEELAHAMALLPDTYRDVVTLRAQGYKYEEMADRLNIPVGTVKNKLHIGREQLTKLMASTKHNSYRMQPTQATPVEGVTVQIDNVVDRHTQCQRILTYLSEFLRPDAFRYVDRDEVQKKLSSVTRFTLDSSFPVLVEGGYLKETQLANRKAYKLLDPFTGLTAERLNELIAEKHGSYAKAAKQKVKGGKGHTSGATKRPQSEKKADTADVPVAALDVRPTSVPTTGPVAAAGQVGFWQGAAFVWYDSREQAAMEASIYALREKRTEPVPLVQLVGEVKMQATFF